MKCKLCNQEISAKRKTMKIEELKIEVETEIHNKGETLAEAMKYCPKNWRISTYAELQWLRNSKYCKELGLLNTWEFVKQEDKISENHGYVARFFADSDWAVLFCYRYPQYSDSDLGVRFVRDLK